MQCVIENSIHLDFMTPDQPAVCVYDDYDPYIFLYHIWQEKTLLFSSNLHDVICARL